MCQLMQQLASMYLKKNWAAFSERQKTLSSADWQNMHYQFGGNKLLQQPQTIASPKPHEALIGELEELEVFDKKKLRLILHDTPATQRWVNKPLTPKVISQPFTGIKQAGSAEKNADGSVKLPGCLANLGKKVK